MPKNANTFDFDGVISEVKFLGETLRYSVTAGNESILVDHSHRPGDNIFAVSEKVCVVFATDQFVMLLA